MSLSKRILIDSIFVVLIAFLPWYALAIIGFFLYWKFEFFEIIFFALIMDVVYASAVLHGPVPFLSFLPYLPCTAVAALGMLILNLFKKRLRFYK